MKKRTLRSLAVMLIAVMVVAMMPMTVSAASKKPGKVKITSFKVSAVNPNTNTTKVVLKWKKASKATGYEVYVKHGTGNWTKLKKYGKSIRKLTIKKVPAGDFYVKVRAVNKKKKGKWSVVKHKYIVSKMTAQKYAEVVEPELKNESIYNETFGVYGPVSYSGNKMIVSFDLRDCYSDADEIDWSNLTGNQTEYLRSQLPNISSQASAYKKSFKLNAGIKDLKVYGRFVYKGSEIVGEYY